MTCSDRQLEGSLCALGASAFGVKPAQARVGVQGLLAGLLGLAIHRLSEDGTVSGLYIIPQVYYCSR
jgi:hypothetical protein